MSIEPAPRRRLGRLALLGACLIAACAQAQFEAGARRGNVTAGGGDAGAQTAVDAGTGTAGQGGAAGAAGMGGTGLTSDEFGSAGTSSADGGSVAPCDYGATPTCDFTRVETCCSQYACERASSDPWNTYPIESCQALVACVQAHPGCSTASAPLCFQDGDTSSPCLDEGYQASHEDPEGPFAFTLKQMKCVCGYP
jgi:hypothetical protein